MIIYVYLRKIIGNFEAVIDINSNNEDVEMKRPHNLQGTYSYQLNLDADLQTTNCC